MGVHLLDSGSLAQPTKQLFEAVRLERDVRDQHSQMSCREEERPRFVSALQYVVAERCCTAVSERNHALRIAGNLAPDIPMHWVPGNHDICPDYQVPTPDGLQELRQHFGDDYYSFSVRETLFLALNSETLNRPDLTQGEAERQMEFIRDELASAQARTAQHVIAFMHTPLFTHDPETDVTGVISKDRRLELLAVFAEHRVEAAFAGHLHLNRNAMHRGMQMVVSGAVGQPLYGPPGYRVVAVADHGVSHQYFPLRPAMSD